MAKNIIVYPLPRMLGIPLPPERIRKAVKRLVLPPETITDRALRIIFQLPGMRGPCISQAESPARMNGGKKYLQETVVEHPPYESETGIYPAQAVSVSQTEPPSAQLHHVWLLKHLHPQLPLKIRIGPNIMIAGEKPYRYTTVRQTGKSSQGPRVSTGNHVPVLIPEIEDVTQQENPGCISAYALEQ